MDEKQIMVLLPRNRYDQVNLYKLLLLLFSLTYNFRFQDWYWRQIVAFWHLVLTLVQLLILI